MSPGEHFKPQEQDEVSNGAKKSNKEQLRYEPVKSIIDAEVPRKNNPYFKNLNIPHLEDVDVSLLEKGKVNIILHPFYEMFLQNERSFDIALWNEIKSNPKKYNPNKPPGVIYCEQWIIKELNKTLRESDKSGISQRYWRVLEMVQEYQALMQSRNSTNTNLYILPKYSQFVKSPEKRNPELYKALIDVVNYSANKKSAFVESEDWSNGLLNESDSALMEIYIPQNTHLTVSGGYMGQCMSNLFDSLNKPRQENNWKINVDVTNSTPVLFFDNPDPNFNPGTLKNLPVESQPSYKSGQQFKSIDEVIAFVEQNNDLNRYITQLSKDHAVRNSKYAYINYK